MFSIHIHVDFSLSHSLPLVCIYFIFLFFVGCSKLNHCFVLFRTFVHKRDYQNEQTKTNVNALHSKVFLGIFLFVIFFFVCCMCVRRWAFQMKYIVIILGAAVATRLISLLLFYQFSPLFFFWFVICFERGKRNRYIIRFIGWADLVSATVKRI